jgi:hypothetical protein
VVTDGFRVDLDHLGSVATNDLPKVYEDVQASADNLARFEMSDTVIGGGPYGGGGHPGTACANLRDAILEMQRHIASNLESAATSLKNIRANYQSFDDSVAGEHG